MIKKIPIILVLILLLCTVSAAAHPLAFAILGYDVKPYQDAAQGFESISRSDVHPFVLSENKGVDVLESIRREKADILIPVGLGALTSVSNIRDIPIVYMMVPENISGTPLSKRTTGINMNVDPAVVFDIVQKALPDVENIGLLYNPLKTGLQVERAQSVLKGTHIRLVSETISRPGDISKKLKALKPRIDAFWMLPDVTLMTPETIEILMIFSLENKIPIITFSEKYVKMGALLSIGSDPYDMGRQAGEMADRILNGADIADIPCEYARKPVVTVNKKVMKKLRIWVDMDRLKNANIVE